MLKRSEEDQKLDMPDYEPDLRSNYLIYIIKPHCCLFLNELFMGTNSDYKGFRRVTSNCG